MKKYVMLFEEFINSCENKFIEVIDDSEQIDEAGTMVYKRKYTDAHPALEAGIYGKVRDKVLERIKDCKITQDEFDNIIKEFNLSQRWLRNNSHLFKIKDGYVSLSETGHRIYRAKIKLNEER